MVYINEVFVDVKEIVNKLGWSECTLLINGGERQEVNQLHFNLIKYRKIKQILIVNFTANL